MAFAGSSWAARAGLPRGPCLSSGRARCAPNVEPPRCHSFSSNGAGCAQNHTGVALTAANGTNCQKYGALSKETTTRPRMAAPRATRWQLEPHTRAKHEILKRYLQAWMVILSQGMFREIL